MALRAVRTAVSKKKRRFIKDGFDLDLSYILPNVIAMGFPSQSAEGLYRNKLSSVQKFLRFYHEESWRVYNLCSERAYDPDKFDGRVARYPFDDHNPPHLSVIKAFVVDAVDWLSRSSDNVAAVHCKAGKGRTGVAICCLLISQGTCIDARTALGFFGEKRTHNAQGVTIPSQQRFVGYWETIVRLHGGVVPPAPALTFWGVRMNYIPRTTSSSYYVRMFCEGFEVFSSTPQTAYLKDPYLDFNTYGMTVQGHLKVVIYNQHVGDDEVVCQFWLHTAFLGDDLVRLTREEIDIAHKDKKGRFHPDFSINAYFGSARLPSDTRSQALGAVAVISTSSTTVVKIMEQPLLSAPPPFQAPAPPSSPDVPLLSSLSASSLQSSPSSPPPLASSLSSGALLSGSPTPPAAASPTRSFFSAHRSGSIIAGRDCFVRARAPSPASDSPQSAKPGGHRALPPASSSCEPKEDLRFYSVWVSTGLLELS